MVSLKQVIGPHQLISSLRGTVAGTIGTVPMTLFMLAMHRLLPRWQRYALPPEEITREAAERMQVRQHMTRPQELTAALVSHFGYGASMGLLYSLFIESWSLAVVVKGMLFGLLIWGGSYLGWLPAANFSVAAPDEPLRRNTLMIAAHLIWGATTALASDALKKKLQSDDLFM
jgi:putative membrane protein